MLPRTSQTPESRSKQPTRKALYIISYDISYHIIWHISYHIISCYIILCKIVSRTSVSPRTLFPLDGRYYHYHYYLCYYYYYYNHYYYRTARTAALQEATYSLSQRRAAASAFRVMYYTLTLYYPILSYIFLYYTILSYPILYWGNLQPLARPRHRLRPNTNSPAPRTGVDTGVCEKNTPPENNTIRKIGFRRTKSGAG